MNGLTVKTVDFACSGKCDVAHMECNQMTTPHVKAETLAVTSDGHPDAVLGNDQGTLTVSGDMQANNEVIGNKGLATGGFVKIKNFDGHPDAILTNENGVCKASPALTSETVSATSVHLKTDGYPDAVVDNWQGRVNVHGDLGATHELVANGNVVTPMLRLLSDGHPEAILTNYNGNCRANGFVAQYDVEWAGGSLWSGGVDAGSKTLKGGEVIVSEAQIGGMIVSSSSNDAAFQVTKNFDIPLKTFQFRGISSDNQGIIQVEFDGDNHYTGAYEIGNAILIQGASGDSTVNTSFINSHAFTYSSLSVDLESAMLTFPVALYSETPALTDTIGPVESVSGWYLRRSHVRSLNMLSTSANESFDLLVTPSF